LNPANPLTALVVVCQLAAAVQKMALLAQFICRPALRQLALLEALGFP